MATGSIGSTRLCVALTASSACLAHVEAACQGGQGAAADQHPLTLCHFSDPRELLKAELQQPRSTPVHVAILDFTPPVAAAPSVEERFIDDNTRTLAWQIGALVAATRVFWRVPLLIVSATASAEEILRVYHRAPIERIAPSADETAWQRMLSRLLDAASQGGQNWGARQQHEAHEAVEVPETALQLDADLWFDAGQCALLEPVGRGIVKLSAQEQLVLTALASTPRCYWNKCRLMQYVEQSLGSALDGQCLEQTICALRRKLGESAREPRLLVSQRTFGYKLCPQVGQLAARTGAD